MFFSPYQAELNPHYETVHQRSVEWADNLGLLRSETDRQRVEVGDYALLCAYFYPKAAEPELQLATDWITWEFVLDDLFADTFQSSRDIAGARAAVSHLRAFLPTEPGPIPSPRNPVEHGLVDLWRRTIRVMSPQWRGRFFGQVLRFAEAFVLETSDLAWNRTPDLIDHIQSRRGASGGEPMFELLEYTMGFEIPAQLCQTRAIQAVRNSILDSVMHVNDIFSLKKERVQQDVHNNVYLIEHLFGCERSQARDYVTKLAESSVRLYQSILENELPAMLDEYHVDAETREQVTRWAELTSYWIPGNLAWHQASRRYRVSELWTPSYDHQKWEPVRAAQ